MPTVIVDVDGTFMKWGTNEPIPSAEQELLAAADAGYMIIFTTQREFGDRDFDMDGFRLYIANKFPNAAIIFGVPSPRILINDQGATAINHPKDEAWHYDLPHVVACMEHELRCRYTKL